MKLVQLAVCALGLFVVVYYERPSLAAVLLSFPLFCLLGFALALPWVIWGPKYNRRRLARIGDREAIAPKEFYRRFYAGSSLSEDVVVKLLNEVAEAAEVPPGLIRPDDRFDDQLAPTRNWDDSLVELIWAMEDRAKRLRIARTDLRRIATVDDYIRTVGELERALASRTSVRAGSV
ncbi:MAG: hypothetical protein DMG22_15575 [Acidobacteria bacterium]|nr:MAG: hypothetical protein DMG22_15575 [Acidobacteriota bacterium]